jgi:uncharacterized protein YegL
MPGRSLIQARFAMRPVAISRNVIFRGFVASLMLAALASAIDTPSIAVVHAQAPPSPTCGPMDVAFVIDTTGSMGGAINSVKSDIAGILTDIENASKSDGVPDYRLALVTFKDDVTVEANFSANNRLTVEPLINALSASGGGDLPEASDEAANTVINALSAEGRAQNVDFTPAFRAGARKILILVTDAPPGGFDDAYVVGVDDENAHARALEARSNGINISAVFVPVSGDYSGQRAIMIDYAKTTDGVFIQTSSTGAGTGAGLADVIAACGVGAEEEQATFSNNDTRQRVDFFEDTANPVSFLVALPGFSGNVTFRAELTSQDQLRDPANDKLVNFPDAQCGEIGPGGKCVEISIVSSPVPTIDCGPTGDLTCVNGRSKWVQSAPYGNPQILHEQSSVPGDDYDENATVQGTFNPLADPSNPLDPSEDWESRGPSAWLLVDLPPFLTLPGNITTATTNAGGTPVLFITSARTAASDVGAAPAPTVACTPASGSTFPLGTTQVICSATSDTGLTAMGSFLVTVLSTPVITSVTGPTAPLALGTPATVSATFTDAGATDTHTCTFAWDDGTSTQVAAANGGCSASHVYSQPGVYTVTVTVVDNTGESDTAVFEFVVIYDPAAGFVTGGGWINSLAGAYVADPSLTGKATFGFVSKYKKGASTPDGETQFQFGLAEFSFQSTSYQWLVISGYKAQYKGSGSINGAGDYGFLLTAYDGQLTGGGGIDRFRIKIWNKATGAVIYDNKLGAPDDLDAADPQAIGGGSIVIHKAK